MKKAAVVLVPTLVVAALATAYAAGGGKSELFSQWQGKPAEPFTDGEATFHKIFDHLKTQYIDATLTDDDLYRAAAQGLLENADPARKDWNKLFTPTEYKEMQADLQGQVSGVGLDFRFESDSGMGVVVEALPGTPAALAGLKAGDRILQVDGVSFAGRQMRDMVYAIRGAEGTEVSLTMLRSASVFTVKLVRARIELSDVELTMMGGGTAYVAIRSFNAHTTDKVRAGIATLPHDTMKSLVVDVRDCPGGMFEAAVSTVGLFVPRGATIVRVKSRDGQEVVHTAPSDPLIGDLPTTVLINHETFSGCEMMAASLKQNRQATLVGATTFGKWSIQHVDELTNHYAMKYTIASMFPPDGADLSGIGVRPDVPVMMEAGELRKLQRLPFEQRLSKDPQLQAAKTVAAAAD